MKAVTTIVTLALLAGCANMSPREKQTAAIVTAVVVGAIIIASDSDGTRINNGCQGNCRDHLPE